MASRPNRLACFDLCCGAGALSRGFAEAGARVLGGIDIDQHALATAARNHPAGHWEVRSIENLAAAIARGEDHIARSATVLLAGLPCQGLSYAGKRDPGDPRNFLYKHFVKIARVVEPEYLVVENVRGISAPRNAAIFRGIVGALQRLGYAIEARVLNAGQQEVPQRRQRMFLVASRAGLPESVFECLPVNGAAGTVRGAFVGLPRKREIKGQSHVFMKHGKKVQKKLAALEPGGPISYRRLEWDKPAPTVIAGHRALPVHPSEPRAISVREAARLQGFADDYLFSGPISLQVGQVANAVPPALARAVAKGIRGSRKHEKKIRGALFHKLARRGSPTLKRQFTRTFRAAHEHRRTYPWRRMTNPFKLLLTEILLQRTNADLAMTAWRDVIDLVPTARAASRADLRSLLPLIGRIGLRSRARTVKKLGAYLCEWHRGRVPEHLDELMRLPGVGLYIAAAVRIFAFDRRDFPVDSNAFRFVSRFFGLPLRRTKREARQIREFMKDIMPPRDPRAYVYGFLDFAALTCRPRGPECASCPLQRSCKYQPKTEEVIPLKQLKESVSRAAYAYTEKYIGPKEKIGNKGKDALRSLGGGGQG